MTDQLPLFNPEATALGYMTVGYRPAPPEPTIPQRAKPLWHVLTNMMTDGVPGIVRAIHARGDDELDQLVVDLSFWVWEASYLSPPAIGGSLAAMIIDLCQDELARRHAPKPVAKELGSWIANTKAANRVEDVAARFTALRPAGYQKLKGLCPMHREQTPSFLVYTDQQKWHCFGGCARGGDVIDLAERLGVRL